MLINLDLGDALTREIEEALLSGLLLKAHTWRESHSISGREVTRRYLLPGSKKSAADGAETSLLQILCTSILEASRVLQSRVPLEDINLQAIDDISTTFLGETQCQISCTFTLSGPSQQRLL